MRTPAAEAFDGGSMAFYSRKVVWTVPRSSIERSPQLDIRGAALSGMARCLRVGECGAWVGPSPAVQTCSGNPFGAPR